MMLLHVPADGKKATVISFPRDSYVAIPGHGMNKLNSAYVDGLDDSHGNKAAAAALLILTVENLTHLSIDHYVQINLLGFYNISEAIGPINVCLIHSERPATSRAEVDVPVAPRGVDGGIEPNGVFVPSYSGIDLPAGTTPIEGKQALAFVRQRHGLTNGDLDRIKRQQYFLSAVFRKVSSAGTLLDPLKLQRLLKAVQGSLTLDTKLDPLKLLQQVQNLTSGNVIFTTIPLAPEMYGSVDGVGSVVELDNAAIPTFTATLIGQDPATALKNAKPAAPGSFTTDVLNASGVDRRATKNAAALTALGFKTVIGAGEPAPQGPTTILYPAGMEGGAKALAAEVPGASLQLSDTVTDVTLYLGSGGAQVKTLTPATTAPTAPSKTVVPVTPKTAPKVTPTSTLPAGVTTAATAGCIN